jgi:hypothetical protein
MCIDEAGYDFNAVNICNVDEYNRWCGVLDNYVDQATKIVPVEMQRRFKIRHASWLKSMWKNADPRRPLILSVEQWNEWNRASAY